MKITRQEIEELAHILKDNALSFIEYSEEGYEIKLGKQQNNVILDNQTIVDTPIAVNNDKVKKEQNLENTKEIKCPLIGHFYLTKTPDSPPYVKVGDVIQKGDVIGILEAMKVSNEIKSEISGEIVDILVESGQFVDFDYVLMTVKEI